MFEGWAIDRDYLEPGADGRVGYGQTLDDAQTSGWHEVSVRRGLKASDVTEPIRFRVLVTVGPGFFIRR